MERENTLIVPAWAMRLILEQEDNGVTSPTQNVCPERNQGRVTRREKNGGSVNKSSSRLAHA